MIFVNSEELCGFEGRTVSELLRAKKYKPALIAVERGGKIIPKNEYDTAVIRENDIIEVVSFVGGG